MLILQTNKKCGHPMSASPSTPYRGLQDPFGNDGREENRANKATGHLPVRAQYFCHCPVDSCQGY